MYHIKYLSTIITWIREQIRERWTQLFSGGILIQRYQTGEYHSQAEVDKVNEL
jgi:hypothetical protein